MSSITIDYSMLGRISRKASTAGSRMGDYIDDLTRRVAGKYSGITGGATSKTLDSEYYVNKKITQLELKKEKYNSFSEAIKTFSEKAQEIDGRVAKKIKASKDQYIDKHDYANTNWWTDIKSWFIDLKNSCPLFSAIGKVIEVTLTGLKNLWADLKHFYKCGGGKEIVNLCLAVGGAIAAVVIAICACVPPICGIVAICAAIGAVIAAINAIVNVCTSYAALVSKNNGDPAWAKIYGDQDTLQDVFRQTNFHNGALNRLSFGAALSIDVLQTVCDVVAIRNGIKNVKNIYKEIKISAGKGKVSFGKRFKQYLFNSNHYLKDGKGNPMKWRDILQKRGGIRTMRENGVTKALSIDQYNKSLTRPKKMAQKISKYAKTGRTIINYTGKFLKYTLGGEFSWSKVTKDFTNELVIKKFATSGAIKNIYDLKSKNFKSLQKDYHGLNGLKGFAH